MATPQEIARLQAQLADLNQRSAMTLGASTGTRRGPAAKAAALSGYLSAIGNGPSSYDDLVKQQAADDAKAQRAAEAAARKADEQAKIDRENQKTKEDREFRAGENAKTRAAQMATAKANRDSRIAAMKDREADRDRLTADQRKDIEGVDSDIFTLNAAEAEVSNPKIKDSLGAVDQMVGRARRDYPILSQPLRLLPGDPADAQKAAAAVEALAAPLRKEISGASLTPQEQAMSRQWMPTADDSIDILLYKTKLKRDFLTARRQRLTERAAAQGYNTAGYVDEPIDPSQWEALPSE